MNEEEPKKEKSVKPCGRILLPNHVLRTILETTGIMSDEVHISTSSEGLDICMVNSAHILMLSTELRPGALPRKADFVVKKPGVVSFSQADAIDFLRSVPKPSIVRFGWKNDTVTFETEDAHCLLMGIEEEYLRPKVPKLTLDASTLCPSKSFISAARACSKVSNKLTLEASKAGVFACASDSATEVRFRLGGLGGSQSQNCYQKSTACSSYPSEYLVKVSTKLGPWVNVRYATDYPVELTTSITEWEIVARFVLAPRIVGGD